MTTLNIIGCGKLGQSLGRLWSDSKEFRIGSILNTSLDSANQAVSHIGSGSACEEMDQMKAADVWLIASNDASIATISSKLSKFKHLRAQDIVFHCSGSLSSSALITCKEKGVDIASIHPVMSFTGTTLSAEDFINVHCSCEGDTAALHLLTQKFSAIGGKCFQISSESKNIYHTATVMCCNYLTALTEASIQLYQQAGIERDQSLALMHPIMTATLANIFQHGTTKALTGPIARGDTETVQNHLNALTDDKLQSIYRSLGEVALTLSEQQGQANQRQLAEMSKLLSNSTN
ncbi:Rossmann-like and DUF2520 domain-containing protein [Rubritalea spongiae]|uniref:Rossmann-like and DUF2520 domain-containing protein n=1 Tax=Rubritalea spongiae TaxID=430797 RepID=A0ABW5DXD8_9BACT